MSQVSELANLNYWDKHFDPNNKSHIKAYKTLMDTGVWPREFADEMISKGCKFTPRVRRYIEVKMLDYFIAERLGE